MSDDFLAGTIAAVFFAVMAWNLGMGMGTGNGRHLMEQEAIAKGFALYCPDTGVFAWVDECGGVE